MEYEKAARLRDDIEALKRAMEKNAVVLADATDADLIAVAEDELEAAVQIFHVRGGRVRGQRGWVTDKVEAVDHRRPRRARPPAAVRRGDAATPSPRRCSSRPCPSPPEPVAAVARPSAAARSVSPAHPAARRQEGPDGDGPAQRPAGARPAQDQARLRPDHPLPRPGGDRRGPRPGLGAAADRVLRHLPPPGRRRRGVHGRLRGRPGPQERVPPLPDQGLRGPGRRPLHARGDRPPLQALPPGEATTGEWERDPAADGEGPDAGRRRPRDGRATRTAAPSASPTRRSSSSSTAGSRRSPPPSGPWTSSASTTSPSAASPSASKRSGCPTTTTRWSCPAPARACICSSASATRPTASPSPTSAPSAPSASGRARWTPSPASARPASRR